MNPFFLYRTAGSLFGAIKEAASSEVVRVRAADVLTGTIRYGAAGTMYELLPENVQQEIADVGDDVIDRLKWTGFKFLGVIVISAGVVVWAYKRL